MREKFLPPKHDPVFRMLFGSEGSKEILAAFLQSVLELPKEDYEGLSITDPFVFPDYPEGKFGIMDVKVRTRQGDVIDIEIQLRSVPNMDKRLVRYMTGGVSEQVTAGEPYGSIQRSIVIVITDYVMLRESPLYHTQFRLRDKTGRIEFTDTLEINVLELPKIPQEVDGTPLWTWLKFLSAKEEDELDRVATENPYVEQAVVRLRELSADDRARRLHESWLIHEEDIRGQKRVEREEGRAEGRVEGEKRKALSVAKNLFTMGLPVDAIAAATGLPRETVESLL